MYAAIIAVKATFGKCRVSLRVSPSYDVGWGCGDGASGCRGVGVTTKGVGVGRAGRRGVGSTTKMVPQIMLSTTNRLTIHSNVWPLARRTLII